MKAPPSVELSVYIQRLIAHFLCERQCFEVEGRKRGSSGMGNSSPLNTPGKIFLFAKLRKS